MTTSEWLLEIKKSRHTAAFPIMTHPGIEMTGHTVREAVTDGRIHFDAIAALNSRFPKSAACSVIMDLTVEAEAFGAKVAFSDENVPTVTGILVSNYEEVVALKMPTITSARIPHYLEACRLSAMSIDKPVFGGCIGPFSLAGRLFGMTEIMMAIYTEPQTIALLLEKCAAFINAYCKAIKATGAAGVIIAEPAAGLISNDDCMQHSSLYIKEIVANVQDDDFIVILHNCGNTGHCTDAMTAVEAKGYHFGNRIDICDALKHTPSDALVLGNLDPVEIFRMATPEHVYNATKELIAKGAGYDNFVVSSGCDIPPGVPIENIEAFYSAFTE